MIEIEPVRFGNGCERRENDEMSLQKGATTYRLSQVRWGHKTQPQNSEVLLVVCCVVFL